MKLDEIKEIARLHNIKSGKAKKAELVRAIQLGRGERALFCQRQSRAVRSEKLSLAERLRLTGERCREW